MKRYAFITFGFLTDNTTLGQSLDDVLSIETKMVYLDDFNEVVMEIFGDVLFDKVVPDLLDGHTVQSGSVFMYVRFLTHERITKQNILAAKFQGGLSA